MNNYRLLDNWLSNLEQVAAPLVGTSKNKILALVRKGGILPNESCYYLECPLTGTVGIDFAAQYSTEEYFNGGTYNGHSRRFFQLYSQIVGANKSFFLELDTAAGKGDKAAVFLQVGPDCAESVLAKTLNWQAEAKRLPAALELLNKAKEHELEVNRFGFMYARFNLPLRFCFGIKQEILLLPDRYDPYVDLVKELDLAKQTETLQKAVAMGQLQTLLRNDVMLQDLIALSEFDFLDCYLSVDLLPDGAIGDLYGIELVFCATNYEQQRKMLANKDFAQLLKLLQQWSVADMRLKALHNCVMATEQQQNGKDYTIGLLSHIKLRYRHNKRLGAKLFLKAYNERVTYVD